MSVRKFVKNPVVIEAMQLTNDNSAEVCKWSNGAVTLVGFEGYESVVIPTLEGFMRADVDDWIIRGVKGEFYPCKPDVFEQTYEEVPE